MDFEEQSKERSPEPNPTRTAIFEAAAGTVAGLTTIWYAFCAVLPLMAALALILPQSPLRLDTYRFTAFGLVIVALAFNFIARFIYGNLTSEKKIARKLTGLTATNNAANAALLKSFLRGYTLKHLAVFSIYEVIGSLGLFLYLRGGELVMILIFIGGAAIMLYLVRPRPERLHIWIEQALTGDD